jgi:hypothetical protein
VVGETPTSAAGVGVGDPSGSSPPGDNGVQPARCRLLRLGERDRSVVSRGDRRVVSRLNWGCFAKTDDIDGLKQWAHEAGRRVWVGGRGGPGGYRWARM